MPLLCGSRVARCCHLQGVPREGCRSCERRGEEGLLFGKEAVAFSVDAVARIQGGTEEDLGDLLSMSGKLHLSEGPEKKCSWLERTCAPSSHRGAVSSMWFECRLSLDALV